MSAKAAPKRKLVGVQQLGEGPVALDRVLNAWLATRPDGVVVYVRPDDREPGSRVAIAYELEARS